MSEQQPERELGTTPSPPPREVLELDEPEMVWTEKGRDDSDIETR